MNIRLLGCILYIISIVSLNNIILSQTIDNKIATNWHFGNKVAINFSLKTPKVDSSIIIADEGSCSISDNSGKLLFYTNGVKLYNSKHLLVENGDSLLGHNSSTQSAIALKMPNSYNLYYLFTVTNIGRNVGFNYSIIDIEANNGLCKVIKKNIKLDSLVTERLAATLHNNNKDYWVTIRKWKSNEIHSYLLTDTGIINKPIKSNLAKAFTTFNSLNTIGQMKFSPNGNKLAIATFGLNLVEIFDFDKNTGKVTNPIIIENKDFSGPYGIEFSPNSNFLYLTYQINSSKIVQYDLSSYTSNFINNNFTIIGIHPDNYYFGSLQLSPNYKIIVANNEENSIGLINLPNKKDDKCNYIPKFLEFENGICNFGLPSFESNLFMNYTNNNYSLVDNSKIEEELINLVENANIKTKTNNSLYNTETKSLILHTDKEFQKGAVWTKNKVDINNFETFFQIKLSKGDNKLILDGSPQGADGFAFVIQDNSNQIIGENAAGIGYSSIPKSIAIEFDCFQNNTGNDDFGDPNGNHIAIMSNGIFANSNNHNESNNLITVNFEEQFYSENNTYYGKITYINNELKVYLDTKCQLDSALITYNVDINEMLKLDDNKAFIGFTASTGNAVQECELVKWILQTDFNIINSIPKNNSNLISSNLISSNNDKKLIFNNLNICENLLIFDLKSNFDYHNFNNLLVDINVFDISGKNLISLQNQSLILGLNSIKLSNLNLDDINQPLILQINIANTKETYIFKFL